jgi:hypothetical protein
MRTWVDFSGRRSKRAELVDFEGGRVYLRDEDGSVSSVSIAKLSQADQDFVESKFARPKTRRTATSGGTLLSTLRERGKSDLEANPYATSNATSYDFSHSSHHAPPYSTPSYGEIPRDSPEKTVHVRGYTRKDGTYVRGHWRRPPRR